MTVAASPLAPPSPSIGRDLLAGLVVFLVALPLCLGIAHASGAPLLSGLISGIIGGLVVGSLSASHVSVSGPAAGLAAVVIAQIRDLGSFDAFLLAVALAGGLQVVLGLVRGGAVANFVPNNVIKGLLAAVGLARWPVRLGELALGGFVVIGFLAAWQRTEPRVAIAERLLGTHLAHRSGPDAAIVADLPRLLFFAGQRPVAPIDRDALLHVASAPGVAFVVLSATAADATVTSALSSRFGRYQMPADLRDLAADRELLVFVRRE